MENIFKICWFNRYLKTRRIKKRRFL